MFIGASHGDAMPGGRGRAWPMTPQESVTARSQSELLPIGFDAGLWPLHWPHPYPLAAPRGLPEERPRSPDALCTIALAARFAAALAGVESSSRLLVLYWIGEARRDLRGAGAAPF